MHNHLSRPIFKKIVSNFIYLLPLLVISSGQAQTSTTEIYQDQINNDIFRAITTTKQGETTIVVTVTYQEKTVDGKKVQKKMRAEKEITDEKHQQVTIIDTMFDQHGVAAAAVTEHHFSSGKWIFTEKKEFGLSGQLINHRKYEVGYDGVTREYPLDEKTGEFGAIGKPITHNQELELLENRVNEGHGHYEKDDPVEKPPTTGDSHSSMNCIPPLTIFVGYATANIDNGVEKARYKGGEATVDWYFAGNTSCDTFVNPFLKTQFGVQGGANFLVFKDGDAKYNLTAFTAGPEVRISHESLAAIAFLKFGVITDGFKYGDIKDHESSFTAIPGIGVDWYTNKQRTFAVTARYEWILTKNYEEKRWQHSLIGGITFGFAQ